MRQAAETSWLLHVCSLKQALYLPSTRPCFFVPQPSLQCLPKNTWGYRVPRLASRPSKPASRQRAQLGHRTPPAPHQKQPIMLQRSRSQPELLLIFSLGCITSAHCFNWHNLHLSIGRGVFKKEKWHLMRLLHKHFLHICMTPVQRHKSQQVTSVSLAWAVIRTAMATQQSSQSEYCLAFRL